MRIAAGRSLPPLDDINVGFKSLKGPIVVPLALSRQDANLQAPLGPGCCFESPYEPGARKSHGWRSPFLSPFRCTWAYNSTYTPPPTPPSPKPISGIMLALSVPDRGDRLWLVRNRHPRVILPRLSPKGIRRDLRKLRLRGGPYRGESAWLRTPATLALCSSVNRRDKRIS